MGQELKQPTKRSQRTADPKGQVERRVMWQKDNAKYCASDDGMVGRWKVFSVYYDAARRKADPNVYKLKCALPGIRPDLGNFEKQEEAKEKAEIILNLWLEGANLEAT